MRALFEAYFCRNPLAYEYCTPSRVKFSPIPTTLMLPICDSESMIDLGSCLISYKADEVLSILAATSSLVQVVQGISGIWLAVTGE